MRSGGGVRVAALVGILTLAGCAASPTSDTVDDSSITLPPSDTGFDYQLGAAYPPPDGAGIVVRDRTANADSGAYSICYLNAFQTQPGEQASWPATVLLREADGTLMVDPNWPDEVLLDISTASQRAVVVEVVTEWIRGCAVDGFEAVEFDNLDTFTRSDGRMTVEDALAVAQPLAAEAHRAGLAVGQKNAAEFAVDLADRAGFDFAIAEECAVFAECSAYTDAYGDAVLAIEYADALPHSFSEVCADPDTPKRTILRDRDLVAPADPAYVFEACRAGSAPRE